MGDCNDDKCKMLDIWIHQNKKNEIKYNDQKKRFIVDNKSSYTINENEIRGFEVAESNV